MNKINVFMSVFALSSVSVVWAAGEHGGGHGPEETEMMRASAVGMSAEYSPGNQQVDVILKDTMRMEFSPSLDTLKAGDAVTFLVVNEGKEPHEFSIGNEQEQSARREMMKKMPDMKHATDNTVTLSPGGEGELNWRFDGDGEVLFACNMPGHFEAGMMLKAQIIN